MLLKAEASVAMMRLGLDAALMAPAGWLAAGESATDVRLWVTVAAIVLARGASNVINDITDIEKDRETNPWLPIPSGTVDPMQAVATLGFLSLGSVGLLAIASQSLVGLVASAGTMTAAAVLIAAYPYIPPGPIAMFVAACPVAAIPLTAWFAAGGGGAAILGVVGMAWLYGVPVNLHGAVRDVDTDLEIGQRTLAVRRGPRFVLTVCATADALAHAAAAAVAYGQGRLALVGPLAALSAAITVRAYAVAIRRQEDPAVRGRFRRVSSMRQLLLVRHGALILMVAAFSPGTAAILGAAAAVVLPLLRRHERRVASGGLRRALATG